MKFELILSLLVLASVGCAKDKVESIESTTPDYYESEGNFLILVIDDTLECVYEYNLSTIQLNNDSLLVNYESVADANNMFNYLYWKLDPNSDTLFSSHPHNFEFFVAPVSSNDLLSLSTSMPFNLNQFQTIGSSPSTSVQDLWEVVSDLDIARTYRESLSNAKIGMSRHVITAFDPQLGFAVPHEKHFLFLAK